MGFLSRLVDRIDEKVDRPADQRILRTDRDREGRSASADADSAEDGSAADRRLRRGHVRARPRWFTFGR